MVKPIYLFKNTLQILFNIIKVMPFPFFKKANNLFIEHQGWLQYSNLNQAKKKKKKAKYMNRTRSGKSRIYYGGRQRCPMNTGPIAISAQMQLENNFFIRE